MKSGVHEETGRRKSNTTVQEEPNRGCLRHPFLLSSNWSKLMKVRREATPLLQRREMKPQCCLGYLGTRPRMPRVAISYFSKVIITNMSHHFFYSSSIQRLYSREHNITEQDDSAVVSVVKDLLAKLSLIEQKLDIQQVRGKDLA